jgi:hypothetical protein
MDKLDNPLVNDPNPVPSSVFVASAIVGFGDVLHTTPLAVIGEPPSLIIEPPLVAVVAVILLTAVVVSLGGPSVVKVTCVP